MIACFKELAIFLAPTINSYKRYAAGSWAPTTLAWGHDNRTCGFRLVGHGAARRVETRIPGGDVNPYLAFAAMIAAGLHGIENELELPPALEGNAYESDAERFPSTLREAILALEIGTMARAAFGDQVVDHYLNYAHTEQALFDKVVTDWERMRLLRARLRVVLISEVAPAVEGLSAMLRAAGHEPVALLCVRHDARALHAAGRARSGSAAGASTSSCRRARPHRAAPAALRAGPRAVHRVPVEDPAGRARRSAHGIVNGHPSLLPRYRGPSPVSWAIRNGETRDRLHVPLHGRRARHREHPRPGARSRSATSTRWEELTPKLATAVGEHAARRPRAGRERRSGRSAGRGEASYVRSSSPSTHGSTGRDRPTRSSGRCARGGSTRGAPATAALSPSSTARPFAFSASSREPATGARWRAQTAHSGSWRRKRA